MEFKNLSIFCLLAASVVATAQETNSYVHEQSDGYEWPTDTAVLRNLDRWQDQKFGVLFHWGIYAVPGIVESWQICSEDWITRPEGSDYETYKKWYWDLANEFNPILFNPNQWADIMRAAGMRYMIFTTKHHDGFCMFNSRFTDYSIAHGPFAGNPRSDVARHVFEAFRAKNFMIGAYFSKPDWHCQWFWNPYYATPNRMQNYKREKHPDWWRRYQTFANNQLRELTTDYGKLDILWLDGGWITGEEVGLDEVLADVRSDKQKGMIVVDRTIKGKNENYQTPEQTIPKKQIAHPWESCISLSQSWAWTANPHFKSARQVVNTLAEITAKGGCLALGVGPTPQGLIQQEAETILRKVGRWLRTYGEAIYNTRITPVYHDGQVWFTAAKDGRTRYAIYTLPDDETLPTTITWKGNVPTGKMTLVGSGKSIRYICRGDQVTVTLPKGLVNESIALKFAVK